jgi:hypothetical protein
MSNQLTRNAHLRQDVRVSERIAVGGVRSEGFGAH